jgi:hypothetical protein
MISMSRRLRHIYKFFGGHMKKWLAILSATCLMMVLTCPAGANSIETITFDTILNPSVNWGVVPNGYMGLNWDNIEVERVTDYQSRFNNHSLTFPSVPLAAFNGGDIGGNKIVSFSSPNPILLNGAYFSTWAQNNSFANFSSHELTVAGYLKGTEVASKTFALIPDFVWQGFNFGPVDTVLFIHKENDNAHWWLMDNVQVSAIPIPATIGLLTGGLLALCFFGRRRTQKLSA